jgi:hypothetical protein
MSEREAPVLGFEPRSEAPQASRIIHCSGLGIAPESRSYPTRAPKKGPLFVVRRGGPRIKARGRNAARDPDFIERRAEPTCAAGSRRIGR